MTLEIGIIGLGRTGTEMAANLVSAERQVTAYVRRQERIGELSSLADFLRLTRLSNHFAAEQEATPGSCSIPHEGLYGFKNT